MIGELEHHFILFSLIFLLIGYLLGTNLKVMNKNAEIKEESFFDKQKRKQKVDNAIKNTTIDIDDSTHVVKIKTDGLEKKYDNIGKSQTTNEDISSSINKLKSLKK